MAIRITDKIAGIVGVAGDGTAIRQPATDVESEVSDNLIAHTRSITWPDLPELLVSADQGCKFCRLLRETLQQMTGLARPGTLYLRFRYHVNYGEFRRLRADSQNVFLLVEVHRLSGEDIPGAFCQFMVASDDGETLKQKARLCQPEDHGHLLIGIWHN